MGFLAPPTGDPMPAGRSSHKQAVLIMILLRSWGSPWLRTQSRGSDTYISISWPVLLSMRPPLLYLGRSHIVRTASQRCLERTFTLDLSLRYLGEGILNLMVVVSFVYKFKCDFCHLLRVSLLAFRPKCAARGEGRSVGGGQHTPPHYPPAIP